MNSLRYRSWPLLATLALGACSSVPPLAPEEARLRVETHAAGTERLHRVAYQLRTAALETCPKTRTHVQPLALVLASAAAGPTEREAARHRFGAESGVFVAGVAGAAVGRVSPGDRLLKIGSKQIPRKPKNDAFLLWLAQQSQQREITLTFADAGTVTLPLEPGCRGLPVLVPADPAFTAAWNADFVLVSSGALRLTDDDDELAFLLAREVGLVNSSYVSQLRGAMLGAAAISGVAKALLPVLLLVPAQLPSGLAAQRVRDAWEDDADLGAVPVLQAAGRDPAAGLRLWARLDGRSGIASKSLQADAERRSAYAAAIAVPDEGALTVCRAANRTLAEPAPSACEPGTD